MTSSTPIDGFDELEVITFFVEDVAACRDFYTGALGLEILHEDATSAIVRFGHLMLNLVTVDEAPSLIHPNPVGTPTSGARVLYTVRVDNVDTTLADLARHGITPLNGPIDRPWGRRTAAFADPAGNVWEIAHLLD